MEKLAAVLLAISCLGFLAAREGASRDIGRLLPVDIAGWAAVPGDRTFGRENIFEYMNGAGEIYLAYNFRRLFVREYARQGQLPLVAEIYEMSSSEDAFGIFSHDTDGEEAALGQGGLYGAGLLRFWKGRHFVRLLAEKETVETRKILFALGVRIAAAVPGTGGKPRLLGCLPPSGLETRSVRYFHKQVSLNSHYYLADENLLSLSETSEAVLAAYRTEAGKATLLICRYAQPKEASAAYKNLCRSFYAGPCKPGTERHVEEMEPGAYSAARRASRYLILVLEGPDRKTCEALLRDAENRIKEAVPWKKK